MIPIAKLKKLSPRHRMRKCAIVLERLERELMAGTELRASLGSELARRAYLGEMGQLLESEPEERVFAAARRLTLVAGPAGEGMESDGAASSVPAGLLLRAVDELRHALLAATGQAPADWDLIDPTTGRLAAAARRVHRGLRLYLDDLRSPFNLGTIFRTAEAFGVEELGLSPAAADPGHTRAARSAMGAAGVLPWRRADLVALVGQGGAWAGEPVYALELGGTELDKFRFPPRGIAVLGSEELGVSPEALSLCTYGIVSIPLYGAKASLNVAVATGILLQAWTRQLEVQEPRP